LDQKTDNKIKTILLTVQILKPATIRLILNENAGQMENEELKTWFRGHNSTSLQEADVQFYQIMKNQSRIVIPSINQSRLLAGLGMEDSGAIILPVRTDFGYCGCFWGCFPEASFDDTLIETFANFNDWVIEVIGNTQKNDFGVEAIAKRYADFLDQQKTPALIVIYPDQISFSNPSFEAMSTKENVLQMIRKNISVDSSFMELVDLYHCRIRDVNFPGGKTGKIFQFVSAAENSVPVSFDANELEYFSLLVEKAGGNLELLDKAGNMSLIQFNYKEKAEAQLKRLNTLIRYEQKHYKNFLNSREGSFEIINIGDLVKDVVFDLISVAKKKNLDINYDSEKVDNSQTQSGKVIGDPWLLSLSIFNLLSNAIRYSKPDSKSIQVDLTYQVDSWILRIQDFGIGISPLDVEKILSDTPDRSPAQDTQAVHGLDFVKYVVKLHRGRFNLESKLGKGSTFTLDIPYY